MAFDLGAMLKDVPDLGTSREQIEYVRLDLIDSDPNNFYQLTGIDQLADNIATCGLQQPIRVRNHPTEAGRYMIVSGHRRRAAVELLAADAPEQWQEVACIVEQDAVSPSLQQLRLIYANANTRKMSDAELGEQAARVEELLYKLKEEGYEFPGRMRDHVAEAVNASKSKLSRLKVIRENLAKCWQPRYKRNDLNESVAYALAQLSVNWQQSIYIVIGDNGYLSAESVKKYMIGFSEIEKLKCNKRGREFPCQNMDAKRVCAVGVGAYSAYHCDKCCSSCPDLISCKYACPVMADKIKSLKVDKREARRQEKAAQEEKDRPQIEAIQSLWMRFGYERERSKKSVKEVYAAMGMCYGKDDGKKVADLENCTTKIATNTKLPFNYSCYLSDVNRLVALADLFGCSIDYLLCRTDVREMAQQTTEQSQNVPKLGTWQTGDPEIPGLYCVLVRFDEDCNPMPEKLKWDGSEWKSGFYAFDPESDGAIIGWVKMPEEDEDD